MLHTRSHVESAGINSGTDKVRQHAYERFYPGFFRDSYRDGGIIEIGYGAGESIGFWKELFPSSHLYILDRDQEFSGEGYDVIKCDQSSEEDLSYIAKLLSGKDIRLIIDDGSHIPEHQIKSYNILFHELLNNGGCYIIEDIECSYWRYGSCYGYPTKYGLNSRHSLVRKARHLPSWINREFLAAKEKKELSRRLTSYGFSIAAISEISSIQFCHNCIAFHKCEDGDQAIMDRRYRNSWNVEPSLPGISLTYFPWLPLPLGSIACRLIGMLVSCKERLPAKRRDD